MQAYHRRASQLRLVAFLLLLAASASLRAAEPEGPAATRLLVVSGIPTCSRQLVGQPCPGQRATECTDMGPDLEPRCLSKCAQDSDCESYDRCVGSGLHGEGPKRCVPREEIAKRCGG